VINIHRLYKYKTNENGDYHFEFVLPDSNERKYVGFIKVRNSIYDYFREIGFEKKCVYWNDSTRFKLIATNEIEMDKIKYNYDGNIYEVCSYKECYLNVNNNYLYYYYNYRDSTFSIISKNDLFSPYLYQETMRFTNVYVPYFTYSMRKILLTAYCYLDNMWIGKNSSDKIKLNCNTVVVNNKLNCESTRTLSVGKYYIFHGNFNVGSTFISAPIHEANFDLNPSQTEIGINNIKISTENYCMESIYSIIIKNNDANSIVFYKYNPKSLYPYQYHLNTGSNSISLSFIAHPGKYYNLQLFNSVGGSKILIFSRKDQHIYVEVKNQYYYLNNNTNIELPQIIINSDFASQINKIYYRNEKKERKFKNDVNFTKANNQCIAKFAPNEAGSYVFSYTLNGDNTKYLVLDKKVIVGEEYYSFVLLLEPSYNILTSIKFSLDIIPMYTSMDLSVYFSTNNQLRTKNYTLTRQRGCSNYDISIDELQKFNKTINYTLVILDKNTDIILYTKLVKFEDFYSEKAAHLSSGIIKIKNIRNPPEGIEIYYSEDEEEMPYIIYKEQQLLINKKMNHLLKFL